jgi:hypothetical protein
MPKIVWRIAPPAHLADAVRKLALAEGRSDTNMINKLISEALAARRSADANVNRLVDIMRGIAESA